MDCLAVETPSSYDHISSFLEDFQDKNSHLFPSSDLSFDMLGPVCDSKFSTPSCGSKRPREASYDSFSSWTNLLSEGLQMNSTDEIISTVNTSENSSIKIKQEHVDKKRKISEDEELSIFMNDARSRSPPFHSLEFDSESIPNDLLSLPPPACTEAIPNSPQNINTPPVLSQALCAIGNLDNSVKNAIFESLQRLSSRAATDRNPIQYPRSSSPIEQINASHDYLTMQTLFGVPPPPTTTIVKSERQNSYIPVTATTAGVPFLMNVAAYAVPSNTITPQCIDASITKYSPCTKTNSYSELQNTPTQHFVVATPSQSMYNINQDTFVHV